MDVDLDPATQMRPTIGGSQCYKTKTINNVRILKPGNSSAEKMSKLDFSENSSLLTHLSPYSVKSRKLVHAQK